MADQDQSPGLLANILAVAGFFILIVIIVWGAYHLLRLTGNGLSSLFSRFTNGGEAITLSLPNSPVQSGRAFTLSWEHTAQEEGSYAFLYQCKSGFRFDISTPAGAQASIPCGSAFTVGTSHSVSLTPNLSGTSSAEVPLSVVFVPVASSTTDRPQGTGTLTVIGGSATSTSGTATTTPTTPVTPRPTTPSTNTGTTGTVPKAPGIADLSVTILATGVIDMYGNFVARAPMHEGEIAAVKFDIGNRGTASTGAWHFSVQLPMQGGYVYASPVQMNLTPGSHIENILRFKPVTPGGGPITVVVDTTHSVRETNEVNNTATVYMPAGSWQHSGYYAPYVY